MLADGLVVEVPVHQRSALGARRTPSSRSADDEEVVADFAAETRPSSTPASSRRRPCSPPVTARSGRAVERRPAASTADRGSAA